MTKKILYLVYRLFVGGNCNELLLRCLSRPATAVEAIRTSRFVAFPPFTKKCLCYCVCCRSCGLSKHCFKHCVSTDGFVLF